MEIAICWTNQAIEDIYQIQEYLEHQSPNLASLFADKIFEKVELLKSFPYIGRIVPEFKLKYVRELIFKQYRIIYTIEDDILTVEVLKVGNRKDVYKR